MKFKDAIEEVRNRINIVDVIGHYVRLNRTGNNYMGLCPFHNEKTPSFSVSESKQIFKCFGCQKGGNVYTFLQEYEGMSFPEAVKYLAKQVNVTIEDDFSYNSEDKKKKELLYKLYKDVANTYYMTLYEDFGKSGFSYLMSRNLTKETIKKFGLGYAPKTYSYMYKIMKDKGYDDNILFESKLFSFKNDKVFDFFYDRVMFPLIDANGNVISFQGRILGSGDQKYINTAQSIIYNKSKNLFAYNFAKKSNKDYIILCEGNMDVITLNQAGFENAVASWGTAFTIDQAKLIKKKVNKVYLCQDTDDAGIKAIISASEILESLGMETYVIDFSPAKDVDEYINKYGKESFSKKIDSPLSTFLFTIHSYNRLYNKENAYEYANYIKAIVLKLCTIKDSLIREKYIKDVAKIEGLDLLNLEKSVENHLKGNSFEATKSENVNKFDTISDSKIKNTNSKIEHMFIYIITENLDLIEKVSQFIVESDLTDEGCKIVYRLLLEGKTIAQIDDYKKSLDENKEKLIDDALYNNDISASNISTKDEIISCINELIRKILLAKFENNKPNINDSDYFEKIAIYNNSINDIKKKVFV